MVTDFEILQKLTLQEGDDIVEEDDDTDDDGIDEGSDDDDDDDEEEGVPEGLYGDSEALEGSHE